MALQEHSPSSVLPRAARLPARLPQKGVSFWAGSSCDQITLATAAFERSDTTEFVAKAWSRSGREPTRAGRMVQELLGLYKQILRAAHRFPSIKRNRIVADIRAEFREGKGLTDQAEITKRRTLASDGLKQLQDYVGIDRNSPDWQVSLRGGSPPNTLKK